MPDRTDSASAGPDRPPAGRRAFALVWLAALLAALLLLAYHFAARAESDWVLVAAFGLCGVAVTGRMLGALRPGERE